MNRTYLSQAIFVDTSAIIAVHDPEAQHHRDAQFFWTATSGIVWASLNVTAHETYTRARFAFGFPSAANLYDLLVGQGVVRVSFSPDDEMEARATLARFSEHDLSFHDALLATVMKRLGGYKIFTFDHHFSLFGFEVLPGPTFPRNAPRGRRSTRRR